MRFSFTTNGILLEIEVRKYGLQKQKYVKIKKKETAYYCADTLNMSF